MISQLTFINQQWFWQIFGIALILWILFAWKEWKQASVKSKLYINLFLAFLGITALSLIVLKPAILKDKGNSKLIILTNGYHQIQLDSLKMMYRKINIIEYKSDVSLYNSIDIPSEVFVLGHGIDPFNLWQLDSIKTTYLNGQPISGIVALKHQNKMVVGKKFELNGYYQMPKIGHVLALAGPGNAVLDSIVINDTLNQTFQLGTKLQAEGNFNYQVIEKDSLGNLISQDPLPISVIPQTPLRVLILNGFPTFETKYLKNYLAEMGHQVVIRSQVTKGKYKYEYFNLETKPLIRFTEEDLNIYDLLIVDSKSLQNLSNSNRLVLENVITNKGLGVIIQPDDTYFLNRKSLADFQFISTSQTEVEFNRWPITKISTYPYQFDPSYYDIAIQSIGDQVFSAYRYLGVGKVGTTTFLNSYSLVLNGGKTIYEELWSEIIENISKSTTQKAAWHSESKLAIKDHPFNFVLRSTIPNPVVKDQNGNTIALKQHIDINTLWAGTTYPKKVGWHRLNIQQDSTQTLNFYVSDSTHFNALRNQYNFKQNQNYFQHEASEVEAQQFPNPIAPIWFYLIFLLSFGYLWLAPKL